MNNSEVIGLPSVVVSKKLSRPGGEEGLFTNASKHTNFYFNISTFEFFKNA
jgi:hypothetical protein